MTNVNDGGSTSLETALLHLDRRNGSGHGAVHAPIHLSVPYGHADTETLIAVFHSSGSSIASRRMTARDRALASSSSAIARTMSA